MLSLCESVGFVPKTPREASVSIKIETDRARFHFSRGELAEHHLNEAEQKAITANNRIALRSLHRLRGFWRFEQHDYPKAAAGFQEAVRMACERRLVDAASETGLALAKFHLGQLTGDDARNEAERLAQLREAAHRYLAMLWLAIGDPEQAKKHALAAYRWAWADGEPYVHRYELTKTTELLVQMNVPNPRSRPTTPPRTNPSPGKPTSALPSKNSARRRK